MTHYFIIRILLLLQFRHFKKLQKVAKPFHADALLQARMLNYTNVKGLRSVCVHGTEYLLKHLTHQSFFEL